MFHFDKSKAISFRNTKVAVLKKKKRTWMFPCEDIVLTLIYCNKKKDFCKSYACMTEPAEVGFERHLKAVIILSASAQ